MHRSSAIMFRAGAAVSRRENPWVILGLTAVGFVGVSWFIKRRGKIFGEGVSAPEGFVPHPGSSDPHTTDLARTFYEGGFEDKMSKSEAARILGVRESANRDRILERYRSLMKINHPDRGGSPLLSLKVNEAKELLSKTAKEGEGKRR